MTALTRRQHGVVARRQLIEAGVTSSAIARMLSSGWLLRVHAGVYAVAGARPTLRGRWMAAVLTSGRRALVSHRSGAELWRLIEPIPGPVHVTTTSGGRSRPGIVFHRSDDVGAHRAVRERIPVTTAERTLLDLAGRLGPATLRRAFEEADRRELLETARLQRVCEQGRGRRGSAALRALVDAHRPLPAIDSVLERRFLRLCEDAGLPRPAIRVPIAGLEEVDCLWPRARLVVELDSYAFHRGRASFERDRARDAALQLAGYRVVRITDRMLEQPDDLVGNLRHLIAQTLAVSRGAC